MLNITNLMHSFRQCTEIRRTHTHTRTHTLLRSDLCAWPKNSSYQRRRSPPWEARLFSLPTSLWAKDKSWQWAESVVWIFSGKHGQSKDICGIEYRRNCRTVPLAAWPFFGPHRMSASCDDTREETHAE